ncbi:MAG: hypothetical protein GY772_15415, partial [bacterium]|nr:hypothetical protein [bacterium]
MLDKDHREILEKCRAVIQIYRTIDPLRSLCFLVAAVTWQPLDLTALQLQPLTKTPDASSDLVHVQPLFRPGGRTYWWANAFEIVEYLNSDALWSCDFWTITPADGTETGALLLAPLANRQPIEWWKGGTNKRKLQQPSAPRHPRPDRRRKAEAEDSSATEVVDSDSDAPDLPPGGATAKASADGSPSRASGDAAQLAHPD